MRWFQAGVSAVALTMMTGCPSEFGKDGRVNKAAHQDAVDLYLTRCTPEWRAKVCAPGREDTQECRECGR